MFKAQESQTLDLVWSNYNDLTRVFHSQMVVNSKGNGTLANRVLGEILFHLARLANFWKKTLNRPLNGKRIFNTKENIETSSDRPYPKRPYPPVR